MNDGTVRTSKALIQSNTVNVYTDSRDVSTHAHITDVSAVSFLDELLERSITLSASDIHIEQGSENALIRFRIDGLLCSIASFENALCLQIVSRIKVLASLNVAERRIPQDGKLSVSYFDRAFDVRVATFPTIHGEKVVLRVLERSMRCHALETLGFTSDMYDAIYKTARASTGFFLVTGPTGSGKTTTLHALLSSIKSPEKNIVTLEDPVEYIIDGITQTHINTDIDFTFEKGIRSILRTDPDIIMVGEIRDKETAHVSLQAALTGHFVVSTLHTTDAPSALLRLLEMGMEPFLLQAGLSAILAQRLVRKLCTACLFEAGPTLEEQAWLNRFEIDLKTIHKGSGCIDCLHTGYKGRTGIFQLLVMSHSIRALLSDQTDYLSIQAQATQEGMGSLLSDAVPKVAAGITSLSEIVRVLV